MPKQRDSKTGFVRWETRYPDHGHPPAAGVVAGEHAERALDLALAAVDHALDDDPGGPGDVEAGERGGGDRGGGTAQCAGHLVLALVVRHRHAWTIVIAGSLPRVMGRSSPRSSALLRWRATSCTGTGCMASRFPPMTWRR
jgi:hypothetical protein